jgi:hypothetical protein
LERHPPITQISRISLLLNLINPINLRRKRLFLGALIPMKICTNCVLPETFPGISFDAGGGAPSAKSTGAAKPRKPSKTASRRNSSNRSKGPRQGLVRCSCRLQRGQGFHLYPHDVKQEFKLKVLAITLDHGFVSPMAVRNIQHVTGVLDMDHLMVRPGAETLRTVFRGSMEPGLYP